MHSSSPLSAYRTLSHHPPKIILPRLIHFDGDDLTDGQPFGPLINEKVSVDLWRIRLGAAGGDAALVDLVDDDIQPVADFRGQFRL